MRGRPFGGDAFSRRSSQFRPWLPALAALLVLSLIPAVPSAASHGGTPTSSGGFVTRSGRTLLVDGEEFQFTGLNIYNANSDGTCGSALDLGLAFDEIGPGKAVVRAWFFQGLATTSGGVRDWTRFDATLATAEEHGIKVIPTLANQWADCEQGYGFKTKAWYQDGYQTVDDPDGTVTYREWVAEIVDRYKNNPTVAFWQLINEAEIQDEPFGDCSQVTDAPATLQNWAADVAGLIKSIDTNHLVSLGTIGGGQCGSANDEYQDVHALNAIDLCEYHDYGSPNDPLPGDQWNGFMVRVSQCAALDKPLFLGETGIIPNTVGGTFEARADAFAAKLDAQFGEGIVGFLAWAYTGGPSTLDDYDIGAGDPVLDVLAFGWNQPPDAVDDEYTVDEGSTTQLSVLDNDSDPDLDNLSITAWDNTSTQGGAVDCSGGSSCDYTPAPGFSGIDTFTYTISDGIDGTDSATVTLTVEEAPELRIDDAAAVEGSPVVFSVSLSAPLSTDLVIGYTSANGSASSPADFAGGSGSVTLPAGAVNTTISVATVNDRLAEPAETFSVTINATGVTIVDATAIGTITPDGDICTIVGTGGADALNGTAGPDVICGSDGNDLINGFAGNDTIFGEAGDDVLRGGTGNDQFSGGNGVDSASFSLSTTAVTVRLDLGTAAGEGNDSLSTIENVFGSELADTIRGNGGANVLQGNGGNDTLHGLAGSDPMIGGAGNDRMFGGDGNDIMQGNTGNDVLEGENGNDALSGNDGSDQLNGGPGNDSLSGGDDADRLGGGAGNDTLVGGPSPTRATVDDLDGGAGASDSCFNGPGLPDRKVRCEIT